jgi:hypothetical protein
MLITAAGYRLQLQDTDTLAEGHKFKDEGYQ